VKYLFGLKCAILNLHGCKSRLGFSPENINFNKYEKNNKYKKNINNLDEELSKIYNPKKNEITKQYDKKILENFNKYIDKEDKSNNVLFNYIVNGKIIKFGQILGYLNTDKNTQTKLKKNIPSDLLLYYIVNVLGLKNSDSIFRLWRRGIYHFLKINIYLFLNFIKIPIVLFIKIPYVLIF